MDIEFRVKNHFKYYTVKMSELNSSFCVLVKQYRGKILGERQKYLFDSVKLISENLY